MNTDRIKQIENAAAEYRMIAERLQEIESRLRDIAVSTGSGEDWKRVTDRWTERIGAQNRGLMVLSKGLESIVLNFRMAERAVDAAPFIFGYDTYGGEFGVSRFENLQEHEEIMPIHAE